MERLRDGLAGFVRSRWFVKLGFFLVFAWSCIELLRFYAWTRGEGPYVPRPEAVAGLLPVGHFTSFFAWVRGGGWDVLLPAGLVIILGAFATSVLLKRGFCGWICPVGTVMEAAAAIGRKLFGRNFVPPRPLDLAGRAFRYVLAALSVGALIMVPLADAVAFRQLPYMWIADIKILVGFFNPIYIVVIIVSLGVAALIGPFWCRYLCPLGGMYSAVGMLSACAVRRDPEACISCGKCTKSCHAFIDVQSSKRVWQPECDGCMDCVEVCPVEECLVAEAPGRTRIGPHVWPALVVILWVLIFGFAKVTGNWDTRVPPDVFRQVVSLGLVQQSSMPDSQQQQ